jgi:hypothetical protein
MPFESCGRGVLISLSRRRPIKPWDCTAIKARQMTAGYIETVKKAGGVVRFIAMDEPLAAGMTQCKLGLDSIVQETATYIKALSTDSDLQALGTTPEVGDIEATRRGASQNWSIGSRRLKARAPSSGSSTSTSTSTARASVRKSTLAVTCAS